MLRLSAAVLLYLGLATAALAQSTISTPAFCNKTFEVNQGATAVAKVVSGVANQAIQLCGWALNSGAATSTATLTTGTGTNCGTSTATIFPIISLAIDGTYVDHVPFVNLALPIANDLCLTTTGTGPISVIIYYAQF